LRKIVYGKVVDETIEEGSGARRKKMTRRLIGGAAESATINFGPAEAARVASNGFDFAETPS